MAYISLTQIYFYFHRNNIAIAPLSLVGCTAAAKTGSVSRMHGEISRAHPACRLHDTAA